MRKNCKFCGKEFETNTPQKRYCTTKCNWANFRTNHKDRHKKYTDKKIYSPNKIKSNCAYCHKEIFLEKKALKSQRNFCSCKCNNAMRGKERTRNKPIKKYCLLCNKEYEVSYAKRKQKYCSNKCCNQANGKNKKKIKQTNAICSICKKPYYTKPSHLLNSKYCSKECMGKSTEHNNLISIAKIGKEKFDILSKQKHYCKLCNKEIPIKYRGFKTNTFCSKECLSKGISGKNNPLWEGGISFEPYGLAWTRKLRKTIRERDNHTCQLCNKHKMQLKKNLFVHHIDYMKINNFTFNLISLCNSCHTLTNHKRKYFKKFFQDYLSDKYRYKYHHITQGTINKWTATAKMERKNNGTRS